VEAGDSARDRHVRQFDTSLISRRESITGEKYKAYDEEGMGKVQGSCTLLNPRESGRYVEAGDSVLDGRSPRRVRERVAILQVC